MNKEQIKYLLDNINCEVKSNKNWVEPLGLDRDTWKALLEYIQQKDKEIERLQRQKEELQVNGLRQETLFKLEIERLNNIIKDIETYIHLWNIEEIGEKTMLILNDILLIKNGMRNEVVRLKDSGKDIKL